MKYGVLITTQVRTHSGPGSDTEDRVEIKLFTGMDDMKSWIGTNVAKGAFQLIQYEELCFSAAVEITRIWVK